MYRATFVLSTALLWALVPSGQAQDPTDRYDKVHKIAIGGDGGWDFLEVDAATRRLYVTRGTRVVVVDLDTEKVVGEIADTPGVHGVAFVPDLGRGVTSNGGDSSATVFDTKTLKTLARVKANGRPDIIYFEPVSTTCLHVQPREQRHHGNRPCRNEGGWLPGAGRRTGAGRLRR